ncbi:MAG: Hsp20/alpha crystallin family protein [Gammaproteobacteria bacterium]|nr:Hsp20/alpha crystallin family protein [Gammaproteobacteria bacterium]NNJ94634.1 Hsp20/alpha crystallin family protein [Halobacteria archaeon]
MSTLQQMREGLNDALDTLLEGWQRLYRFAAGAITRFTPGKAAGQPDAGEDQGLATRSIGWSVLAAEVFDSDDKIVVRLEAPGMDNEDFDIQVHDDYLVVQGEKQVEQEHRRGHYRITECAYGRFERAIPLPENVDADRATANYRNGILRVELPRTDAEARSIKINLS